MVLGLLRSLFGGGKRDGVDRGEYYYLRCAKCGEAIRLRVDRAQDLAPEFEVGGDNPSGFTATKGVVGKQCFRMISVRIEFDQGRRETARSAEGGEFITREEYEAALAAV